MPACVIDVELGLTVIVAACVPVGGEQEVVWRPETAAAMLACGCVDEAGVSKGWREFVACCGDGTCSAAMGGASVVAVEFDGACCDVAT